MRLKKLEFKTVWIEYPDIRALCDKFNVGPTGPQPNGQPWYTLPIIQDPSTGETVADSIAIAEYLDKTYPLSPTLIPTGTRALQYAFQDAFSAVIAPIYPVALPRLHTYLIPGSQDYFRKTREEWYGAKMEDFSPLGPIRDGQMKKAKESFATMAGWLKKNGEGGKYVMGDIVSYADITLASLLMAVRTTFGPSSEEWKQIKEWDGGIWDEYVRCFEQYAV